MVTRDMTRLGKNVPSSLKARIATIQSSHPVAMFSDAIQQDQRQSNSLRVGSARVDDASF